jgi:predicted nucleic acid-binding protein
MTVMLVDTSVLTLMHVPAVADAVEPYLLDGSTATCALIDLQLFAGIGDPARVEKIAKARSASFRWLPTDDADLRLAVMNQAALRRWVIGWPTVVVAAVAAGHGATVLHYDDSFDVIAGVTGQATQWVAPKGSIDRGR